MPESESPCQRYGLLRLPKVTERRDGPRPGDNDDDDDEVATERGWRFSVLNVERDHCYLLHDPVIHR